MSSVDLSSEMTFFILIAEKVGTFISKEQLKKIVDTVALGLIIDDNFPDFKQDDAIALVKIINDAADGLYRKNENDYETSLAYYIRFLSISRIFSSCETVKNVTEFQRTLKSCVDAKIIKPAAELLFVSMIGTIAGKVLVNFGIIDEIERKINR